MLDDEGNELENGAKTGVTETQLNRFELPVQVRRWVKEKPTDEQETVLKSETLTQYDGLGRKHQEESGLGNAEQKQRKNSPTMVSIACWLMNYVRMRLFTEPLRHTPTRIYPSPFG
ncbi:hypothetical protein ABH853_07455 [Pseudomonas sp. 13.2]|uniref:Transposase n=1 Tax=Pseudomonas sp. 13.2 TaxID=3144665 RepID=A0AAU7BK44_9PSED